MKQEKTMKIKTMYRTQCLAAVEGYGPEYDTDNIIEPTLIVSISSPADKFFSGRESRHGRHVGHVIRPQFSCQPKRAVFVSISFRFRYHPQASVSSERVHLSCDFETTA